MKIKILTLGFYFFINGCVTQNTEEELKKIIFETYPDFENQVQLMIKKEYGENIFKKANWEWKIEESLKNNEYNIKYGIFRELNLSEEMLGEVVGGVTEGVSLGFVKYNPRSPDKGVYVRMVVNTKSRKIKFPK